MCACVLSWIGHLSVMLEIWNRNKEVPDTASRVGARIKIPLRPPPTTTSLPTSSTATADNVALPMVLRDYELRYPCIGGWTPCCAGQRHCDHSAERLIQQIASPTLNVDHDDILFDTSIAAFGFRGRVPSAVEVTHVVRTPAELCAAMSFAKDEAAAAPRVLEIADPTLVCALLYDFSPDDLRVPVKFILPARNPNNGQLDPIEETLYGEEYKRKVASRKWAEKQNAGFSSLPSTQTRASQGGAKRRRLYWGCRSWREDAPRFKAWLDHPLVDEVLYGQTPPLAHPKLRIMPLGPGRRFVELARNRSSSDMATHARAKHGRGKRSLLYVNFSNGSHARIHALSTLRRTFGDDLVNEYCGSATHWIRNFGCNTSGIDLTGLSKRMSAAAFTVAPPGMGEDCYRIHEILLSGSVPVLLRTNFSMGLFRGSGLPHLLVNKWEDVTPKLLTSQLSRFYGKDGEAASWDLSRLTKSYWRGRLRDWSAYAGRLDEKGRFAVSHTVSPRYHTTCRWKWDEHPGAIGFVSLPLFLICICAIIVADDKGWLEPNKASVTSYFQS